MRRVQSQRRLRCCLRFDEQVFLGLFQFCSMFASISVYYVLEAPLYSYRPVNNKGHCARRAYRTPRITQQQNSLVSSSGRLGVSRAPQYFKMASGASPDDNGQRKGKLSSNLDTIVPREKLPTRLQKLVDDEDTLLDQIYDGT